MKMKLGWLVVSYLLVSTLFLTSCAPAGTEEEAAIPPAKEAETTPTTPAASRVVLYSDDFNDETSGWDTYEDVEGWVNYKEGWMHLTNKTDSEIATTTYAYQNFADFTLKVETKLISGTDENWHTVGVRVNEMGEGYLFGIGADGTYGISVVVGDSVHDLVQCTRSIHILKGKDVINLIEVQCVGSTHRMFINGNLVSEITDSRFRTGDIALMATSSSGTFTEIAFDNLVVTAP